MNHKGVCRTFPATQGLVIRPDQETRLCQTHSDDLQDNIWTILDHIISYYTILHHIGRVWINFKHLRITLTILDNFEQV